MRKSELTTNVSWIRLLSEPKAVPGCFPGNAYHQRGGLIQYQGHCLASRMCLGVRLASMGITELGEGCVGCRPCIQLLKASPVCATCKMIPYFGPGTELDKPECNYKVERNTHTMA